MDKVYVPYVENKPVTIEVNGHRFLLLASDEDDLLENFDHLGDSEVREFDVNLDQVSEGNLDLSTELSEITQRANAGVLVKPPGISTSLLIESLKSELPWVH
jgi:hypothetical protein